MKNAFSVQILGGMGDIHYDTTKVIHSIEWFFSLLFLIYCLISIFFKSMSFTYDQKRKWDIPQSTITEEPHRSLWNQPHSQFISPETPLGVSFLKEILSTLLQKPYQLWFKMMRLIFLVRSEEGTQLVQHLCVQSRANFSIFFLWHPGLWLLSVLLVTKRLLCSTAMAFIHVLGS